MNSHHPYWLVAISFSLALAPIVVGLFTSFIKVHVVLSFFRSGLGAQQVPSGLVILGIAIALTLSIMTPTIDAFQEKLSAFPMEQFQKNPQKVKGTVIQDLLSPWHAFLEAHTGERELAMFQELEVAQREIQRKAVEEDPENSDGIEPAPKESSEIARWNVLLPAFVVTELKEAFIVGFVILLPFLAIDLIVANILAGMGMFMVSPVMISLPLKVALFTFADGWLLLTKGLTESYLFTVGG
jgi:type III secretory pathway component EscR